MRSILARSQPVSSLSGTASGNLLPAWDQQVVLEVNSSPPPPNASSSTAEPPGTAFSATADARAVSGSQELWACKLMCAYNVPKFDSMHGAREGLNPLLLIWCTHTMLPLPFTLACANLSWTHGAGVQVASSYANLAGLLRGQYRYGEAQAFTRKALEIRMHTLAPTHPDLAAAHISLAHLLQELGQYAP